MKTICSFLTVGLFSLFLLNNLSAQTCLPNGIALTTQAEVDDFATNYPGCSVILGDLQIGDISNSNAINDLNGLSQLTSIGDDLTISYTSISTLGLSNLTSIGGDLNITQSPGLTNMAGLENLSSIGGDLDIDFNPNLVDFTGLENLTSLGGNLDLYSNVRLVNLAGLTGLTAIVGDLAIRNCIVLTNMTGMENLTTIGGDLEIRNSNVFVNMTGLENLTTIGDDFYINACDVLEDLNNLSNLSSIDGDLVISETVALTNLTGLDNLNSIGGLRISSNSSLTDLTALNNLTSLEHAVFSYNSALTSFEGLNNITSIDSMLVIESNNGLINMEGFDELSYIGENLRFFANSALVNMEGLSNLNTIGGSLQIIGSNFSSLINLTGLENVTSLGGRLEIKYSNNLTDLTALDNLASIDGDIIIEDNDNLTSLAGLGRIDYTTITNIKIKFHTNLSVCGLPNICNYLTNGGNSNISQNGAGCSNITEILNTCSSLARLYSVPFYDINQDKIQNNGELIYTGYPVIVNPGAWSFYPNTASDNIFLINPGNYNASYDLNGTNWELTTDSASLFVSLAPTETDTVYFGVYPTQLISEQISSMNSTVARCNEVATFDVTTQNMGTTITSGTLWFIADTNATSIQYIDIPDVVIAPNIYGWNFTDLYPGQTLTKQINIGIPGPPDFPVGGLLNFDTYVQYTDDNGVHTSELFEYHTIVECSFDPNDKLVFPSRNIEFPVNYTLFDESLYYTVRFQNTGNAVAYDIVILDTLDANLDRSTFQFLGSSHANKLTTTMDENGILAFDFKDIFLPDSTSNFEGSQGYVSYLIKGNPGLAENTIINNSAGIYFDANPPIITNTTENVMVSTLPTVSTTSPDDLPDVFIFPNPNTGLFEVTGIVEGDYTVLNVAGQIIKTGTITGDSFIDISNAPRGVYFISISIDRQTLVKRIVKM